MSSLASRSHAPHGNHFALFSLVPQAPAWELQRRSSSFAKQEAGTSRTEFPSWSLRTSEQRVKDAQAKVNHLTQAILAKAFRGELTTDWRTQNPDLISGENSAEALLAKIKAEPETLAKPKKTGKKAKA